MFISMHLFFSMGSPKGAAAGGLAPPGKDGRGQRPPQLAVRWFGGAACRAVLLLVCLCGWDGQLGTAPGCVRVVREG